MSDKVIVPVSDLKKIEYARQDLYKLIEILDVGPEFLTELANITGPMWIVGNKNYPKAD